MWRHTSTATARLALGRIHTFDARAATDEARPEGLGARLPVAVRRAGDEGAGLPFHKRDGMSLGLRMGGG